jgi:hypothetical protein
MLMKVTTTATSKDIVKQIIIDGEIKRFTAEETLTAIHQRGIKCGLTRLKQLKKEIKQDARDWITNLSKERNEYIALYKQGIDTLRVCQQELWKLYHEQDTKTIVKVQCMMGVGKLQSEITSLYDAMPVVMYLKDVIGNGSGEVNNKQW